MTFTNGERLIIDSIWSFDSVCGTITGLSDKTITNVCWDGLASLWITGFIELDH